MRPKESKVKELGNRILAILIFLILSPLILLMLFAYPSSVLRDLSLGYRVKRHWFPNKKYILFVYSNSPNWKEYIETSILPKIAANAVTVNWSERADWPADSLETLIFENWAGKQDFNPIAIIFIPWFRPRILRFWKAFKDFKHGKEKPLKNLENQMFEILLKAEAVK